jgi:hypothetical protein
MNGKRDGCEKHRIFRMFCWVGKMFSANEISTNFFAVISEILEF